MAAVGDAHGVAGERLAGLGLVLHRPLRIELAVGVHVAQCGQRVLHLRLDGAVHQAAAGGLKPGVGVGAERPEEAFRPVPQPLVQHHGDGVVLAVAVRVVVGEGARHLQEVLGGARRLQTQVVQPVLAHPEVTVGIQSRRRTGNALHAPAVADGVEDHLPVGAHHLLGERRGVLLPQVGHVGQQIRLGKLLEVDQALAALQGDHVGQVAGGHGQLQLLLRLRAVRHPLVDHVDAQFVAHRPRPAVVLEGLPGGRFELVVDRFARGLPRALDPLHVDGRLVGAEVAGGDGGRAGARRLLLAARQRHRRRRQQRHGCPHQTGPDSIHSCTSFVSAAGTCRRARSPAADIAGEPITRAVCGTTWGYQITSMSG